MCKIQSKICSHASAHPMTMTNNETCLYLEKGGDSKKLQTTICIKPKVYISLSSRKHNMYFQLGNMFMRNNCTILHNMMIV